jgi:hypothetical protein
MEKSAAPFEAKGPKAAETNVQAGPPPIAVNGAAPVPEPALKSIKTPKHPARLVLEKLADLRITVTLFALALVLVFWGTLAQTDSGVLTVVRNYFRSFLAWVPLKVVFFNRMEETSLKIPYPGGFLIGSVMMVNLLAAHAIRFKLAWNRAGIILIHAGIIIMMLGEIVTHVYANEAQMIIRVGQKVSSVVDIRSSELAIIETKDAKTDNVVAVPARLLKTRATVDDPKVPFKIEVLHFMVHSKLRDAPGNKEATKGFGRSTAADELPEVSGVEGQKVDFPSVYVTLSTHEGKELGTWLLSTYFADPQWQWVELGNKKYKIALRFKETTRDFTMHLTKFDHKVYPGDPTKTKDYRSYIHLVDEKQNVNRHVEIYMNAPLYYRGETFYQSGMDRDGGVIITTLQVVRNPGWVLPYISCAVVGIGLLIHFGHTLYRFLEKRTVR